ncbi:MAG TPA: hypothetical protein PLZ36_09735 [Armatimonadota bacterium]|nr:hypothetical protein [Armatimonadota bacterium]
MFTPLSRRIALIGLLLAVPPAFAAYSGLVGIPTADIMPAGAYAVVAQTDGALPGRDLDTYLLCATVGVTDWLEVGADYDFSAGAATRGYLDAKLLLPTAAEDGAPHIAVGVFNIARNTDASPYVVLTREFPPLRAHAGAMLLDNDPQAFFGVDRALGDRWAVMADYTTGPAQCATVGVCTDLTDRLNLLVGALFPNAGGETRFTVQLGFGGSYRACPAQE